MNTEAGGVEHDGVESARPTHVHLLPIQAETEVRTKVLFAD
jgi:hypothetical protein